MLKNRRKVFRMLHGGGQKTAKCYTKNDDVTRRVTLSEKQPIDLKADFAKLSRVNKIAWFYAQQGFDVLLGFRGKKEGTGWNVPNRQRMTPKRPPLKHKPHTDKQTPFYCVVRVVRL